MTWMKWVATFALLAATSTRSMAEAPAAHSASEKSENEAVLNYCLNISDQAAEARMAIQTERLKSLESKIDAKVKELDARQIELREWVEKQRQLQGAAESGLIEIYSAMDPEAAAGQLAALDVHIASSVLRQLKPRVASGILDEMKPEQAAELVRIIAAATAKEAKRQ
jgi:flagellar motility protein MotE (MotC chaperone)